MSSPNIHRACALSDAIMVSVGAFSKNASVTTPVSLAFGVRNSKPELP